MCPRFCFYNFVLYGLWLILCFNVWAKSAEGQIERSELGKRLQRFEVAWETATELQRQQASDPMQVAVTRFFGMQLRNAASKLDEAWMIVRNQQTTDWERNCLPYYMALKRQVIRNPGDFVELSIERFYDSAASPGAHESVQLTLRTAIPGNDQNADSNSSKVYQVMFNLAAASKGVRIPVQEIVPQFDWQRGDYQMQATLIDADQQRFDLLPVTISFIPEWETHLQKISAFLDTDANQLSDTVKASIKSHVDIFRQVAAGEVQETDYPIARMMTFCETIMENPSQATKAIVRTAAKDDIWLTLRRQRKQVPVRVRAPPNIPTDATAADNPAANLPIPVLVLLHGAGGSENMFFETYGAGRTVRMGLERGWLVVAPRQGLVAGVGGLSFDMPQILDELEALFPIDRSRVFLIGHSMGAGQVVRQLGQHPQVAIAAAAIGGGSPIRNPSEVKQIGWFVSAGELDFGRRGAEGLKNSLQRGAIADDKLMFKIYPGIEHMAIVQASLDDLFQFFDQQ